MSTSNYLPTVYYMVGLSYNIELPGPDKKYVEIIGSYESLQDAKLAVEENVDLIMDNDKQYLSIYKINLDDCKIYDFYRKDLKLAVDKAFQKQKLKNALHFKLHKQQ